MALVFHERVGLDGCIRYAFAHKGLDPGIMPAPFKACAPLERTRSAQPCLAGASPAHAGSVVFSIFQWARVGTPRDVLAKAGSMDAVRAWRSRMVALYGGLGDRFALYPAQCSGLDGRTIEA